MEKTEGELRSQNDVNNENKNYNEIYDYQHNTNK